METVSKDVNTARSMFKRTELRLKHVMKETIDEENASFIFEDVYEVIKECAQCLMVADGYNSKSSHEANVAFIKDMYREYGDAYVEAYDRYRRMRNQSMYRIAYHAPEDVIEAIDIADEFVRVTSLILGSK